MRRLLGTAALTAAAFLLGDSKPNPTPPATGPGPASEPKTGNTKRPWRWRRWAAWAAVLLPALAIAGFLVAASGVIPVKASSGHWPITEWFLHFSMQRSVSTHTLGTKVPPLDDPALVLRGAGHYETACRPCHGSPELHHPRIAAAMTPHPPYLPHRIPNWDPEELFYITKHGVKFTGMPAWPTQQRDDEVWAMTAFLLEYQDMDAAEYRRLVHGETAPPAPDAAAPEGDAPLQGLLGPEAVPESVRANCARCHGTDGRGRGNAAFPTLAGQKPAYFEAALLAYASGDRHSGIMAPIAAGLNREQIRELARYYAGLPAAGPPPGADNSAAPIARGAKIAHLGVPARRVPACVACHGPGDLPRNPAYPELAGQFADYLALQLELFKDQRRGGSEYGHLMHPVAERLSPQDMRDVAAYYASLPPAGRVSE